MKYNTQRMLLGRMGQENRCKLEASGLGPEDCAAIFGQDPEKSAFTLWAEKSGKLSPEEEGEAQRFNRENRGYVAKRFSQATGKAVRRVDAMLHNPRYPNAFSELHYLVLGENAGLTCQCVSRLSLGRFRGKEYPKAFYYPCLHRMLITGREKWYLAVLVLQKELRIFEFIADPDELRCLAQGEEQFWRRVTEKCPPMPDGSRSTRKTLERMYPLGRERSVDLSPISLQLHDYLRWQERLEQAWDALTLREAAIKAFLGDAQKGHLGDIQVSWIREPTAAGEQTQSFQVCRGGEPAPVREPLTEGLVVQ